MVSVCDKDFFFSFFKEDTYLKKLSGVQRVPLEMCQYGAVGRLLLKEMILTTFDLSRGAA